MSETGVIDAEQQLIESRRFRYEPQHPADVAEGIKAAELRRVHGTLRNLDVAGDQFKIIADKPRKVADEEVFDLYAVSHMWWMSLSPELNNGQLAENPFDSEQSETRILTSEEGIETVVYNFGEPLSDECAESISSAYDWFNNFTHGHFDSARTLIIADDLRTVNPDPTIEEGLEKTVLGYYFPSHGGKVLVNQSAFNYGEDITVYSPYIEAGVSLADVILTHEFARALYRFPHVARGFRETMNWQTHQYTIGKGRKATQWEITGQGNGDVSLPVHPSITWNSTEDFAESLVQYRFNRDTLDDTRYNFFQELSGLFAPHYYEDPQPQPVDMETASQPLYPYHRVPQEIGVRILKESQLSRLRAREEAMDRMSKKLMGTIDMMDALKRNYSEI